MTNHDSRDPRAWLDVVTSAEVDQLQAAYEVLTRLGQETADGETWDNLLDAAQQKLGVMLALVTAAEPRGTSSRDA